MEAVADNSPRNESDLIVPPQTDPVAIVDVWSRTAPKYRRRAIIMLFLLWLLFAGLCSFAFWLRTGAPLPWTYDQYADLMARSFMPTGQNQITLADFLSHPINVRDVPIHAVIMGLLFASLTSIPILVTILYRLPSAIVLCAMVIFLAAMPWLGLTVLLGCILSVLPAFRFTFRYASALIGLVPIAIYFVSASWQPSTASTRSFQNQALMYAPWVLALLSSCVICAVALLIARLINYRPGGIPPLLTALFAIPVFLFHTQVGRDELSYRVLEVSIGPTGHAMFAKLDAGMMAEREAARSWSEAQDTSFAELSRHLFDRYVDRALVDAETDRLRAIDACDRFIRDFPQSRYVANVLFLKGQAQDHRLIRSSLVQNQRIEYRNDSPGLASLATWETIRQQFPSSSLVAMALYKLAILQTREGKLTDALNLLNTLLLRFDLARATTQPRTPPPDARNFVFQRTDPTAGLGLDVPALVLQARRLRELIEACQGDAPRSFQELFVAVPKDAERTVHPVQLLLWLDETDPAYASNLRALIAHFPESITADFARIRLTMQEAAISRRIDRFRVLVSQLANRPSAAQAMFCLAEVLEDDNITDEARARYDDLSRTHPNSCWAQEAAARLATLSVAEGSEDASSR
ncbi:MAG: hypothetical protein HBSAPP02_00690 [Phycisphaerae bacterium]|nr:MAG: outer membrane protein assembly factor BamD [Planctomycetia bacterium]RIK70901.1 MAG: hypothetical protein DCC66_03240 [Planctomycetota bacterium]GJQ25037.1 MAG: hypothetical protein HBSAPP02_00690 [Phycisphaerae bacterium]